MARNGLTAEAKTTTLTSLAILTVDIDSGSRDYIDYLGAFVVEGLALRRPDIVNESEVVTILMEEFGLRIPLKAVQNVLRRLARRPDLFVEEHGLYRLAGNFPVASMTERREAARDRIADVYARLASFSEAIGVEPAWNVSQASDAVVSFLGRFAIDCLKTHVFSTALPSIPESSAKEHFVVGKFLEDAHQNKRDVFESFIVLVKGQMYANALTCPDLQSLQQKFSTLTCYLDTPLILNLLGLHGVAFESATREMVELVRGLSGSTAAFHHTVEEVRNVLRYCSTNFEVVGATNRALREIRSVGLPKSELILMEGNLEQRLKDLNIKIVDTPAYREEFQIDEGAFREAIKEEVSYLGDAALSKDVNSIRSIYVKRQGKTPIRLEDAGAILVTSNSNLARAAYDQGKQHNSSREVSPVITDYSLANVAWLKSPLLKPNLPLQETLALCYAGLEPSGVLVEKYVRTMDRMRSGGRISEEDHALLRASNVAEVELMNLTLGDDSALTEQSITRILSRAKESLAAELVKVHEGIVRAKDAEISAAQESIVGQTKRAEAAEAQRDAMLQKAKRLANAIARTLMALLAVLLIVPLVTGSVFSSGLIDVTQFRNDGLMKNAVTVAIIITVVIGLWGAITGHSVFSIVERLSRRIEAVLLRLILPSK